jgi:O-antigen/teichoic acid export membrane protein
VPDMKLRFAGEFAWVLAGKVIAFIGSILLIKLLTHSMDVEGYAQLILGLTICNFFTQIIMGATGQGVGRVYVDAVEVKNFTGFSSGIFAINKNILIIYAIFLISASIIFAFYSNLELYALIVSLFFYSYLNGLNDISSGLHNLARNRAESAIGPSLDAIVKIGLIYGLYLAFQKLNAISVICAYLVSSSLVLLYQNKVFQKLKLKYANSSINGEYWKNEIIKIALPASFGGFFVWLQQASDKWALKYFQGNESVSQYSIIYQIGYAPFLMGMSVVMTFSIPLIYRRGKNNIVRGLVCLVVVLTLMAFLIASQFAKEILGLVVSDEYSKAAPLLQFMILAAGFYQLGDVYAAQLMQEKRSRTLLKIKISTALVCLIANSYGAYLYGVAGVVSSMVLFGFLYFITFFCISFFRKNNGVSNVA